jgi:hypothetical protein
MLKRSLQSNNNMENHNEEGQYLCIEEIKKIQLDSTIHESIDPNSKAALPSPERIKEFLGTEKEFTDKDGYLHEILALTKNNENICVIESKEKMVKNLLDISIKCKILSNGKLIIEKDIESYNPFFGCDVLFIAWIEDSVIFVYTEKHNTYVGKYTIDTDIVFQNIGRTWKYSKNILGFYKWNDENIYILQIPELKIIGKVNEKTAGELGINPK